MSASVSTLSSSQYPQASLSTLPEELLERVLGECITDLVANKHSPALYNTSPFPSPSNSPFVTPSNSKRSSPCPSPTSSQYATPADTPAVSPTRSRPSSPAFPVQSHPVLEPACQPPTIHPATSSSTLTSTPSTSAYHVVASTSGILAPLLVSRLFHRIGSPLLYRNITLSSRSQTQKLLEGSLRHRPERARWIRRLVIMGIWQGAGEVLGILGAVNSMQINSISQWSGKGKAREVIDDEDLPIVGLQVLEITIDAAPLNLSQVQRQPIRLPIHPGHAGSVQSPGAPQDVDADEFCGGLLALTGGDGTKGLKHLVLRKPQNVYLTHQRAKIVIGTLAKVVESARGLESTHIAFRLSDDPVPPGSRRTTGSPSLSPPSSAPPSSAPAGPITAFTQALSECPALHTLITHLPSVWNNAILRMSTNEALERIVLLGAGGKPVSIGGDRRDSSVRADGHTHGSAVLRPPRLPMSQPPLPTQTRNLPSHPLERVYADSARGVDGYAAGVVRPGFTTPRSPSSVLPPPSGLFVNEARKHERLCALVHVGSIGEDEEGAPTQEELSSESSSSPSLVHGGRRPAVPLIAVPTPTRSRSSQFLASSNGSPQGLGIYSTACSSLFS